MYTACTYDAYRCANASESPLSLSLLYPTNRNEEEKKGAVKILYSFDRDSPLSKERSEVSFFVKRKRRPPPFARTRVCALSRSLRIFYRKRNILADRVTGGLPQESSERFHFSFHPHSLSPPFPRRGTLVRPSFLPSFLSNSPPLASNKTV